MRRLNARGCDGYTVPEILLVLATLTTFAGIAVPMWSNTVDHLRAAGAARYVAGRVAGLRIEAIRRSSVVALRFERVDGDYRFAPYLDGNGNGLRADDVTQSIDTALAGVERLRHHFPDTRFGLLAGVPDLDGALGSDGVRIGSSAFLSLSPDGTATSGTLYIHGRRAQYTVRILARASGGCWTSGSRPCGDARRFHPLLHVTWVSAPSHSAPSSHPSPRGKD